jgi:hypothetical protein
VSDSRVIDGTCTQITSTCGTSFSKLKNLNKLLSISSLFIVELRYDNSINSSTFIEVKSIPYRFLGRNNFRITHSGYLKVEAIKGNFSSISSSILDFITAGFYVSRS